jgi:hypothetical protein
MTDINAIYINSFGIAFQWPTEHKKKKEKIQLVFRDTGLMLCKEELEQFLKNIKSTKDSNSLCSDCSQNGSCKALLVNSPVPQVSFAMNAEELIAIDYLVAGTLFRLNLEKYLKSLFRN